MKRYLREEGSEAVRGAMADARHWLVSRVGYVETLSAIARVTSSRSRAVRRFVAEWDQLVIVEVTGDVAHRAAQVSIGAGLRSLDAIHLASALAPPERPRLATWDARLWRAARREGFEVIPDRL